MVGAPDAVASVFVPPLLATLRREAPGVALGVHTLMPRAGESRLAGAWQEALAALEFGALDAAVVPHDDFPARFAHRRLYEEDFVIVGRREHPYFAGRRARGLEARPPARLEDGRSGGFRRCAARGAGADRRIAITVPGFFFALAAVAESDLLAAVPRSLAVAYADRFELSCADAPLDFGRFAISVVTPAVALGDGGVTWLLERLAAGCRGADWGAN